jgi:hypothetical protein
MIYGYRVGRGWFVFELVPGAIQSNQQMLVTLTAISRDGKGKLLFEKNSESGVFDRDQSDRSAIGTAFSGIESRVNS